MLTKDLQTLNHKFDQVMFNSLVLTWERNFEVMFGIFSVLVFQINVLESYLKNYVLKLVMIKNVKIVIIQAFKSKFYQYFVFTKRILHRFLILHQFNLYVLLICGKKLVTMKVFLLNFLGGSKCVTKWQFLLIF